MALSSNTLTHFTSKKECLFGIIEDNFKIHFCRETVVLGGKKHVFYAPMVSFCDIPMSEIKDHIKKYGSYGIGLSKEWGVRNGLNPVLYVSHNSHLSNSYRSVLKHFILDALNQDEDITNEQLKLMDVIRYMKNYEGELKRKTEIVAKYRYSDEREWRYAPDVDAEKELLIGAADYDKNPDNFRDLYGDCRLKFEPSDIKYIIVNDDSEISEVVEFLRKSVGKKHSLHEVERLTTRILTAEQIAGDF